MDRPIEIESLSDEALVRRIVKTNDTHLFEQLYDRHVAIVYNKCYGFAKDADEAKDMTQDVFLKLFVKLASFKEKSKFSTWLYAFTYNHCVNYITRDTHAKMKQKSVEVSNLYDLSEDFDDDTDFRTMKVDKLKEALSLVTPEEKMILLLKYQDDLSIKELEVILDVGESAVKMRLKRAKEKLYNVYNELIYGKAI